MTNLAHVERIDRAILVIREKKVMLDGDLAALYGVSTKVLNQAVKRNRDRFPEDFMFQLTAEEKEEAVRDGGDHLNQFKFSPTLPYAFSEHGAFMVATVLRNPMATRISIEILRAFARLGQDEEPPPPSPYERPVRSLFAAIRDAVLLLPVDSQFTTDEPYTYFVQAGEEGPIKIGSTRNLPVRLRTLCAMSPVPLKLLGVMRSDVEDHCHARFGAFHVHGEWFASSSVILEFINEHGITPGAVGRHGKLAPCGDVV